MVDIPRKQLLEASPHLFAKDIFSLRMTEAHIKMMDNISGAENRSLLLCNRGIGKSKIAQAYIAWLALRDPNTRIILVSSTDTKASSFMRAIRLVLESPAVKDVWGSVKGDNWTEHELTLSGRTEIHAEATIMCLGAGSGSIVGRHSDVVVLDDVCDFDSTRSELQRNRLRDWVLTSMLPVLMSDGRVIACGTRYHFADIYNTLINRLSYKTLILPPIKADGTAQCEFLLPLKDVVNKKGVVVQVGLETMKHDLGSVIYALQYENDVSLLMEGNIIQSAWIQYYDKLPELTDVVVACDPAISKSDTADSTAIIVGGRGEDGNIYVKEYVNTRMSFGETQHKLEALIDKHDPKQVRIEQVGFSEAFISELRIKVPTTYINGVKPIGDKESRLREVSPMLENMLVYFGQKHGDVVDQLLLFPDGDHDDLVDGMQLFLSYYSKPVSPMVVF